MPETEVAASPVLMEKDAESRNLKEIGMEKIEVPKEDKKEERNSSENDENNEKPEKKDEKKSSLADIEFVKESRNRVKLYVLCEQRVWDDRGTGHVTCASLPDQPSTFCIVVRLESNGKNVLESKILLETAYQKQQETLIVWSESDNCDLALSFQEKSGCEEIWAKICEVQGRDPEDGGYEDLEEGEVDGGQAGTSGSAGHVKVSRGGSVVLPPCQIGRLQEIELLLGNHTQTPALREKMANAIESDNYVQKLCELFRICEDLENVEGLRTLAQIAKHLFHLNRNSIVDILFAEENEKDVLGMLEFDPAHTEPRHHREFLYEKTKFKDVLKIEKQEIRERIRHAYHVQYIQDVCFPAPSIFEENLLSVLTSHLFFCRVEIVGMLLEEKVLRELFTELKDLSTTPSRRSDLAKFLREFCSFSQALQTTGQNSRESFFKTLMQNDVLGTVEPCIRSSDLETRSTIVEMLFMMVEYNPQMVRDYLLRQAKDRTEDEILMNLLIKHMLSDRDAELSSAEQVSQVLRTLLDPDNMVTHKTEKSEFLTFFYRKCMGTLVKPILEIVEGGVLRKDDYYTANLSCLVVRLLCFCVEHHAFNMRSHCLSTGLLSKVLVLLKSRHHFLTLGALKMLRGVCSLKDDFYYRDIVKNGALDKVVECFMNNGPRYNLLNSAIIELFDFLRQEDVKTLIRYTIEKHWSAFEKVRYVKTFEQLRTRYEQYLDRERPVDLPKELIVEKAKEKLEAEEEQWFSNDDDDDSSVSQPTTVAGTSDSPARKQGAEPTYPSVLKQKQEEEEEDDSVFSGGQFKRRTPSIIKIIRPLGGSGSTSPSLNGGSPGSDDRSSSGSRSPSPLSQLQPGEDEVTSSQPGSKENSPQASSTALKTLSEYGDSDSEPDDDLSDSGSTGGDSREDDVTSTSGILSGTKRRRTDSPPPLDTVKKSRSESPPPTDTVVGTIGSGGAGDGPSTPATTSAE